MICIIKNIGNIGNMKIQRLYFQNSHKKKMLWNHVKCAYWAWNHNLPPTRRMHYFQNILWNVVTSEDEIITWTLSTNRKNPHNVKDFASFWSNGPFMVMGVCCQFLGRWDSYPSSLMPVSKFWQKSTKK